MKVVIEKEVKLGRDRTGDLQIRSLTRYPLRH
jgi:hypothetical protein